MTAFARALDEHAPRGTGPRRWLFVPYDQLTAELGPLSREPPSELGIILVECPQKAERRPYHKQKLALVLANLRHFAIEQAARRVAVRHVVAATDYASALLPLAAELGPLRMMEPAERELRVELAPLVGSGALEVVPHEGWLTTDADFAAAAAKGATGGEPPWRMDRFYAAVRRRTGILMDGDKPRGGRMSHDAENRKPYRGSPPAPLPPRFTADAITRRRSATLLSTPLRRSKREAVALAMISASVVFPVPGGPKRMIEEIRSASIARRSNFPAPRMCPCPAYSPSERGRIR